MAPLHEFAQPFEEAGRGRAVDHVVIEVAVTWRYSRVQTRSPTVIPTAAAGGMVRLSSTT